MITVNMLSETDLINPEDYCRPLDFTPQMDDSLHDRDLGGSPINNLKWVQVKYILGPCWYGEIIANFHRNAIVKYEFISTNSQKIPASHCLNKIDMKALNAY